MRSGLPVVASDAGAIPDTLGDAGILLGDTTPDTVAAALERVVRDAALRKDLIARGQRHLLAFTPEAVADDLAQALALADWELPAFRRRELAVVSSDRRSGIHHYALAVCDGLRAAGHRASVRRHEAPRRGGSFDEAPLHREGDRRGHLRARGRHLQ